MDCTTAPRLALVACLVNFACGDESSRTCADRSTVLVCESPDDCVESVCRGDELCEQGACIAWSEATLEVDFSAERHPTRANRWTFRVEPGGFPRAWAEQIRFDLGDGVAGWGEQIEHDYDEPGVYAVELDVRLKGLIPLRASRLIVVEPLPADWSPLRLSLAKIPDYLNGSIPFLSDSGTPDDPADDVRTPFHLLVARHGVGVDVRILDTPGDPIVRSSLSVTTTTSLGDASLPAGAELIDRFTFEDSPALLAPRAEWKVDRASAFPDGTLTLTLSGRTQSGARHEQRLTFEAVELTPERAPFDRAMQWLFRFDMDYFTTTPKVENDGALVIDTIVGENGATDFEEELTVIGARSDDSAAGAAAVSGRGATGASDVYMRWIQDEIVKEVYRHYGIRPDGTPAGGIPFSILVAGRSGAPDPKDFADDGAFSIMRFGGVMDGLGRSRFGPYNEPRVDDSSVHLGVATTKLLQFVVGVPGLDEQIAPLLPHKGTPVGQHAADATVLADAFDRHAPINDPAHDARFDQLANVAHLIGLMVASVTAHEMGHAMGLVPNGPPPAGFFGNRADVEFIGASHTDSHHADYPGLNLMQAGGDFLGVIGEAVSSVELPADYSFVELFEMMMHENRLSPYMRAYLQGQLTHATF